jgi:hypothetical protein
MSDTLNNLHLVIDLKEDCSNSELLKLIKNIYNNFTADYKKILDEDPEEEEFKLIFEKYEKLMYKLIEKQSVSESVLINHCIKVAYKNKSEDKTLCWALFGNVMVENIKNNTPNRNRYIITDASSKDTDANEFLGNYYKLTVEEDYSKKNRRRK